MRSSFQIAHTGKRIQRQGEALAKIDEHFNDIVDVRDKLLVLEAALCNLTTITHKHSDIDPREHERIRTSWRHVHAAMKAAGHAVVTLNMAVEEPIMHPAEDQP